MSPSPFHRVSSMSSLFLTNVSPRRFIFFSLTRHPPKSPLLSLHDALPISEPFGERFCMYLPLLRKGVLHGCQFFRDRKSTRLNSSHANISYAVFCLKKKKQKVITNSERADGEVDK